jgi:Holliday junction DNA helicase RuvA
MSVVFTVFFQSFAVMISQLSGTVVHKGAMDVVIDCHGVGYAVSVPLSTIDHVPPVGENVTLLTILAVREDAMQLYGFFSDAEREAFRLLTTIQGIGGRTALGILSATTLDGLRTAIGTGDTSALTRLPGIGKKTAERMVVELREKIIGIVPDPHAAQPSMVGGLSPAADDAVRALQALGYTRAAAEKAVARVLQTDASLATSTEALIRGALRQ